EGETESVFYHCALACWRGAVGTHLMGRVLLDGFPAWVVVFHVSRGVVTLAIRTSERVLHTGFFCPPCLWQGRCTRERRARTRRADTGSVGGRGDAGERPSACTPSVLTGGQCRARVPRPASTR